MPSVTEILAKRDALPPVLALGESVQKILMALSVPHRNFVWSLIQSLAETTRNNDAPIAVGIRNASTGELFSVQKMTEQHLKFCNEDAERMRDAGMLAEVVELSVSHSHSPYSSVLSSSPKKEAEEILFLANDKVEMREVVTHIIHFATEEEAQGVIEGFSSLDLQRVCRFLSLVYEGRKDAVKDILKMTIRARLDADIVRRVGSSVQCYFTSPASFRELFEKEKSAWRKVEEIVVSLPQENREFVIGQLYLLPIHRFCRFLGISLLSKRECVEKILEEVEERKKGSSSD